MKLSQLVGALLAMPRVVKRLVVLSLDAGLCLLTVWLAFYLRLGEFVTLFDAPLWVALTSIAIALPVFMAFDLYRAIFRYSGWPALMTVTKATAVYGLIFSIFFTVVGVSGVPRTIGLIQPMLLLFMVGASRAWARFWLGGATHQGHIKKAHLPRVLIYGAGDAGRQLAAAMANSHEMRIVGFLDDDQSLHGHVINGQPVYNPTDLATFVVTLRINKVLLALPSASRKRRNEILMQMRAAHVLVRTLPSVTELAQGKVGIADLRELDIDDLLGREPVVPDSILLSKNIAGKVVLVTGAGGSIGSELCRQILQLKPSCLLLIEQSEFALYNIHQELQAQSSAWTLKLIPLLACVCDQMRMRRIMTTWRPDTVYHAAAYKHVPLVEHNPSEGIRNNVLGTLTTAQVAIEQGVADFVLISTDKAVRSTNIMGASKRLAEMILQALAANTHHTQFAMVRFGNVLGSSGSVVPKFRQQISDGGPITLTHLEMTRYFMTIAEAAQLVIQAGAMAKGGDVFVLDMGQPVKIMDLARRMIELSGLTVKDQARPDGDIEIEVTGLRPGEKLYEELLIGDNPEPTSHPRIMRAIEEFAPWAVLKEKLNVLEELLQAGQATQVRSMLEQLVPGYLPNGEVVDWVQLEQDAQSH